MQATNDVSGALANHKRRDWRERRAGLLTLVIGLVVLLSCYFAYFHAYRVHEIHFIAPNAYHGFFWIIEDPNGERVTPIEGRVTLRIPPDGIARVRDSYFEEQWHVTSAEDYSGRKIADDAGALTRPAGNGVWGLSSGSTDMYGRKFNWTTYLIGTSAEVREANRSEDEAFEQLRARLGQESKEMSKHPGPPDAARKRVG